MCFSATSSFIASGVIGAIGVATLRHVREPRTLLFAAVPMLFAVHQASEGFVWLGLTGRIGAAARDHAVFLFTLYAQGILPLLIPMAVMLMEPAGPRRRAMLALTVAGALLCGWDISGLVTTPSVAVIDHRAIAYINPAIGGLRISLLYILVTCGALLLSTHRVIRWYGVLNVMGLTVVELVRAYAFASIWCFYAATLSVVIYWQFNRRWIDIATPNGRSPAARPFLLPWLHRRGGAG